MIFSCFYSDDRRKAAIIGGSTAGVILILAILLVIFGYHWRQRARSQEKTAILTARMTGYDDEVSLSLNRELKTLILSLNILQVQYNLKN